MKSLLYSALSTAVGVLAAIASKSLIGSAWPGSPPKNPASASVTWVDAVQWTLISSIGAGVARLVGRRLLASTWEKASGDIPPTFQKA